MRWHHKIALRFRSLLRRRAIEQDLSDELRFHLEKSIESAAAKGQSTEEARYAALRELGGLEQIKEECRDTRRVNYIENFVQDLRYGWRQLRRNPGFTTVAVAALALGIGANTAVFSLLNTVLLRPLPYRDSERLVWVTQFAPRIDSTIVPAASFLAWRDKSRSFRDLSAYADHLCDGNFSTRGEPVRLDRCAEVTPNFFSVLGVRPQLGRVFSPAEGLPGAHGAMILTDGFWRRRFGADPAVLGETIELDGTAYMVVGILPASFEHPGELSPDAFVPLALPSKADWSARESDGMSVIARLRPGITIGAARAELQTITRSLEREYPQNIAEKLFGSEVQVMPLHEQMVGNTRTALLVLMGAVGLVLLIGCVNVANLLLARAVARQREFAVRAALGATRFRIRRQLLTEGIFLALLGSAAGLLLASLTLVVVRSLQPAIFAHFGSAHLNGAALAFTLAISFATGVLFSLAPASLVFSQDLSDPLGEAAGRATVGVVRGRYGNALVALELALALPLLVGAGLLIRSYSNLRSVNPGFDPKNVLTVQVTLTESNYSRPSQQKMFFDRLLAGVQSLPGVEAVGGTTALPLYYGFSRTESIGIENRPSAVAGAAPAVPLSRVTPGYFEAMRIPLEAGRLFSAADREGTRPVVIVSRDFTRRFLGGENPIGLHLRFPATHNAAEQEFTIVGVVGDVHYFGPGGQLVPVVFMSAAQFPASALTLAVRTRTNPGSMTAAIRTEVRNLDGEQPIYHVATMEQRLADSVGPERFNALLVSLFAAVASLLAAVGTFGVMHFSVSQRTHEIGIRAACGAQPGDVVLLVLGQGATLAAFGVAMGICAALALTRFLTSLLFGVGPADPHTFVAVAVLLAFVALVASYFPARRAAKVDPMAALRYE